MKETVFWFLFTYIISNVSKELVIIENNKWTAKLAFLFLKILVSIMGQQACKIKVAHLAEAFN